MSTNPKPDPFRALIDADRGGKRTFTVVQDGRSGKITTTTSDGETFEGRDGINDALFRFATGAEPRNRPLVDDDPEGAA